MIIKTQFVCVLPTKSFLASKNSVPELLSLNQKFTLQCIKRVFAFSADASNWMFCLLGIVLSIFRITDTLKKLPFYNIEALFYQMAFSTSVLCVTISVGMLLVIDNKLFGMNFVIICWIVLSILGIKLTRSAIKNRLFRVVFNSFIPACSIKVHLCQRVPL